MLTLGMGWSEISMKNSICMFLNMSARLLISCKEKYSKCTVENALKE